MTRLLASLLVALLMTATLAMPVEAAGKPGSMLTVVVNYSAAGAGSTCSYGVALSFNAPKKTGYDIRVMLFKPDAEVTAQELANIEPTSHMDTVYLSATFQNGTYWVVVNTYKPNDRDGTRTLVAQAITSSWTHSGSCSLGQVALYER